MRGSYVLSGRAVLERVELFLPQIMKLVSNQQQSVVCSAQKLWFLLAEKKKKYLQKTIFLLAAAPDQNSGC